MEIALTVRATEDLSFWQKSGNKKILERIRQLLESIQESPFEGIGKPEALKYNYAPKWSRRITQKDRLVYEINENRIIVFSFKGHYNL